MKVDVEYHCGAEHHNPMEPHATTVVVGADGRYTVHDKTQGAMNSLAYVTSVFGLSQKDVRVFAPYVGGAFGSGLRPQYQLFLAMMAAIDLRRSVRVEMTRDQMFTFTHRPETIQRMTLGAEADCTLRSIRHEAIASTSTFEDYQENVVNWSGMLYRCDNVDFDYKLAALNIYTPGDMRAPGATHGVFALETAMDELAVAAGVDPIALRLRNYSEKDANENKRFTSKEFARVL